MIVFVPIVRHVKEGVSPVQLLEANIKIDLSSHIIVELVHIKERYGLFIKFHKLGECPYDLPEG